MRRSCERSTFWDNELADPDFNKFADLARRFDPTATLVEAVDGDLARSPCHVKLYTALGASDELRVAFVAGSSCLAVGVFLRPGQEGPFTAPELADARSLVPVATMALRRALGRVYRDATTRAPVVIMLDGEGNITGVSAGGQEALEDLRIDGVDGDFPGLIQVAATKARWSRSAANLTTQLLDRSGRWLRLHVTPMGGEMGAVAVTVETARPDDLVRILLDSYSLTPRETEIVLGSAGA